MQTNMRKPEAKPADEPALSLQEQANLLNVTRDAIFVMDMEGVIKYWNLGAEERYGWTAEQAVGRVVHDLLKTVFPAPLEQIKAEVMRTGRWEGELVHTKKDGTQVVAASRWSLRAGQARCAGCNPGDQQRHHRAQAGGGGAARNRTEISGARGACQQHCPALAARRANHSPERVWPAFFRVHGIRDSRPSRDRHHCPRNRKPWAGSTHADGRNLCQPVGVRAKRQ